MNLWSTKITFFETKMAKIITDYKCARQELSNDVSHDYVATSFKM